LIPALGAEGAANLHRQMTERTLRIARQGYESTGYELKVFFSTHRGQADLFVSPATIAADQAQLQHWLGADLAYQVQQGQDLGERMFQAFLDAFDAGSDRAVIIGTDCPELTADILRQAFEALQTHNLVLGPASDGGYYLIGLQRSVAELFQNIPWGSDQVLTQTCQIADQLGLTMTQLPVLTDIDRPEDLHVWETIQQSA